MTRLPTKAEILAFVADNPTKATKRVLANKASLRPENWPRGRPDLAPHFRPSLAYRMCLVAEGRFDAMLTFRPTWHWDVAAGALICEEAGARVTDPSGAPLSFDAAPPQSPGVVAAEARLHAALLP